MSKQIHEVNGEKYEKATVISKGKTYRASSTAKSYYFMTGWTFTIGDTEEEITYSASTLKERLNSGTIWEKV